jgi:serine/threonine protein kinase
MTRANEDRESATNRERAGAGSPMRVSRLDDQLDLWVAEYAERLARRPDDDGADLVRKLPEEHREALERCFRMMRAGLAAAPRASAPLGPGVVLAGHRIERELGRGGMAVVYLATHLDLKRKVALKVLRPGLALERRHVERFEREALAAARLKHPHIVQVYGVGEQDGYHWLSMEYVEGGTLSDAYARLPKPAERTAESLARALGLARDAFGDVSFEQALGALLTPIARALAVTHDLGLLHRDVKPSNILIAADGRAQLADFGLAKSDGDPGLSLTGEPIGTPYYMSPEQAALSANVVDARSDVYSFGVTFYEGLAGQCPFQGASVIAVLAALRDAHAPALRTFNRNVSRNAEALVRRAMAREPGDRYRSAMELAADCDALSAGQATHASALEGGPFARWQREVRRALCSQGAGYRSSAEFLGLPLLHINGGVSGSRRRRRVAKGWIAIGDIAIGGIALGGVACGGIAFGGMSAGFVSIAGLAVGGLAFGGWAIGGVAFGGLAVGYAAIGGGALGYYALAGDAYWSAHAITGRATDPEALEFFRGLEPWIRWLPYSEAFLARLR